MHAAVFNVFFPTFSWWNRTTGTRLRAGVHAGLAKKQESDVRCLSVALSRRRRHLHRGAHHVGALVSANCYILAINSRNAGGRRRRGIYQWLRVVRAAAGNCPNCVNSVAERRSLFDGKRHRRELWATTRDLQRAAPRRRLWPWRPRRPPFQRRVDVCSRRLFLGEIFDEERESCHRIRLQNPRIRLIYASLFAKTAATTNKKQTQNKRRWQINSKFTKYTASR